MLRQLGVVVEKEKEGGETVVKEEEWRGEEEEEDCGKRGEEEDCNKLTRTISDKEKYVYLKQGHIYFASATLYDTHMVWSKWAKCSPGAGLDLGLCQWGIIRNLLLDYC